MTRVLEINKLLFMADQYAGKLGIETSSLLREVRRTKLYTESSNYTSVLEVCQDLSLVIRDDKHMRLTSDGQRYLALMTRNGQQAILDPNPAQKRFLVGMIQSSAVVVERLKPFFDEFKIDFLTEDKIWFATHTKTDLPDDLIMEVGLVRMRGGRIEVDSTWSVAVSRIRNNETITASELDEILEGQKAAGDVAESRTVEYEKERLSAAGYPDLALAVRKISKVDPFAGYDVLSFDGGNLSYEHDRKIEVKGTGLSRNRFYWSRNQINVARKYGDGYWIYYWRNIAGSGEPTLEKIRDPYDKFFAKRMGRLSPVKYEVEWKEMELSCTRRACPTDHDQTSSTA